MSVVALGLRAGLAGVLRARTLVVAASIVALAAAGALAEARIDPAGSATRSLEQIAFGFLVPLAAFGAVAAAVGARRLSEAATPLARFGASRRGVALGLVLASMAAAALVCSALALATALCAHDASAPPLAADLASSAWIGLLAGAAYAALFSVGATFGARGGGRTLLLVADFVVAGSTGLGAALLPRAHALNLVGAPPPLAMSQPESALALAALAVVCAALAVVRCPP